MSDTENEEKSLLTSTDDIPMTFPQRLMEILSNESNSDTMTWLPHGKAFIIYKKKKFAADILPKYFKQSKFTSFTRKLNRWGFTRVTRGPETGSYFHKFFLRDQPRLCMQMSCQNTRLQNEQMVMEQQMQSMGMPYGLGAAAAGGMNAGLGAGTGINGAMGGMGAAGMNAGMLGANPALLQMQRQLQLEQQLQQQQQFELLRRAMAQQQTPQQQQQAITQQQNHQLSGMGGGMGGSSGAGAGGGDAQKKDDLIYMQMLAQSKVSAQPLMRAIQSSLFQNPGYAPPPQPPQPSEADRAVRRASAA